MSRQPLLRLAELGLDQPTSMQLSSPSQLPGQAMLTHDSARNVAVGVGIRVVLGVREGGTRLGVSPCVMADELPCVLYA